MRKFPKEDLWLAIACLACEIVFWLRLDDFGASEFSGGRLTGPRSKLAVFRPIVVSAGAPSGHFFFGESRQL